MKIKNVVVMLFLVIPMVFILGACDGNNDAAENNEQTSNNVASNMISEKTVVAGATMEDGTYRLEETDFDDNGWKVFLEITVEDGKIVSVGYDYINDDGLLKSEDEEYQDAMFKVSGKGPKEFTKELSDALVAAQDAKEIDIISGATGSSETFMNYAQQLIQAAQKGETDTIMIHNQSPLQDGKYSLEEKNIGSTGWRFVMNMTVENGKIIKSDYNYLNADGELKTDDEEYQEIMTEKSGLGPQDFVPKLNQALVETQNPSQIDMISGATHSTEVFKIYAAQLVNAAQKGDTTKIEIDNFVYEN